PGRTAVADGVGDRVGGAGQRQPPAGEVISERRAGDAPRGRGDPPWYAAVPRANLPACARSQVEEGKGRLGLAHPVGRADKAEIVAGAAVAAEDKVVAVVDLAPEPRTGKGAAAPAGMAHRLVEHDRAALFAQAERGREAGEPGSDDMHG